MDLPVKEICFSQDTAERRSWFKAGSFAHPAKMHLSLQIYLIENYTKPGDTILDPMAGSGTILVACALGRNVICAELEEKFVKMQRANWEKVKAQGAMLGYTMGEATILQGDARNMEGLLADSCIFSPPYAEAQIGDNRKTHNLTIQGIGRKNGKNRGDSLVKQNKTFNNNPSNIGNLPYKADAIISSPPYNAEPTVSKKYLKIRSETGRDTTKPSQQYAKYSAKADVICTSPPYEGIEKAGKSGIDWSKKKDKQRTMESRIKTIENIASGYASNSDNIGNLKSENYLSAMLQVYQQCHRVLRDGGLLVLVTKNFIRNKQIVRLDTDTIKLCESARFTLKEQFKRKLTQQSFWRTIFIAAEKVRYHPTQKPIQLMLWCVKKYSKANELVLDCWCGAGSTCVAAKLLGRRYIGIDISPEYCKIAEERLRAVETGVPVAEQRAGQMGLFEEI